MEMMSNNAIRILKYQKKIEKALNIKISIKGRKIRTEGDNVDEYLAERFFEAVEAGFSVRISLLLADDNYVLEKLSIKNYTKRDNLSLIRARLIGHHGETRELIEDLSDCFIKVHDNFVYILGRAEDIKKAQNAVIKIIQGSKQSSVYAYLEKQRGIQHEDDLGLKDKADKKDKF